MSTVTDHNADALLEPEPPLWHRSLVTVVVCGLATAVFLWAAGRHPGGRLPDRRLAVAECWDAIEQTQPASETLHAMRVACQRMESANGDALPGTGQAVAMGE